MSSARDRDGRISTLLRHSAVYGLGSIASKVASIALLPVYTRFLTRADYGRVELTLTLVMALAIVVQLGLNNALFRYWFDSSERANRMLVFRSAFFTVLATSSACLVLLVVVAGPIAGALFGTTTQVTTDLVRIAALGLWANALYDLFKALLRVQQRPVAFTLVSLSNLAITTGTSIWLVVVEDMRARGLLLGNYTGTLLALICLAIVQYQWLVPRPSRSILRSMLAFGLPMVPAAAALWVVNLANRPIVNAILGASALGVYAIGAKIAQGILLLVSAFQLAWPAFAHSIVDDAQARRTYARTLSLYAASMLWAVCVLDAIAPWAIRLLSRPAFYGGVDAVLPLSLGAALYGAYFVASIGAARVKRTQSNWLIAATAGVVELGLLYLLTGRFGIAGAAWAVCAAYGSMVVLMLAYSQSCFHVPYQWWRLTRTVAAAAVALVTIAWLPATGTASLVVRTAVALAFPLALAVVGVVTREERTRLLALGRRYQTEIR